MTTSIQFRRQLIVAILLGAAVVGAFIRHYAETGALRNVGTLMMLIWVPIVGNIVGWLAGKIKRRPQTTVAGTLPPSFIAGSAFKPQALVDITLRSASVPAEDKAIAEGEHHCAFVVDNQAFSARWLLAQGEAVMRRGQSRAVQVEFLAPAVALPQFAADTRFRMLVGQSFIGDGRVVALIVPSPITPSPIKPS